LVLAGPDSKTGSGRAREFGTCWFGQLCKEWASWGNSYYVLPVLTPVMTWILHLDWGTLSGSDWDKKLQEAGFNQMRWQAVSDGAHPTSIDSVTWWIIQ
jgi:hypothetical protein